MKLQQKHADLEVRVFLIADAVAAALPAQTKSQGYYNIARMLKAVIDNEGQVKTYGIWIEAAGLGKLALVEGVEASTMDQLRFCLLLAPETQSTTKCDI